MNIITQHFSLIEPGPVQRLGGLTLFPLTVETKSCPPSLQTFDQLADQGCAGAFEHGVDGSVTSINIENNSPSDIQTLNQKIEADYHNTYYNTRTKSYGTRTLKLANKDWHKLNTI